MNETLLVIALAAALAGLVAAWFRARSLARPHPEPTVALSNASVLDGFGGPEQLLDHLEEGVLVVDPNARVRYANQTARQILGLQARTDGRLPSADIAETIRQAFGGEGRSQDLVDVFFPARRSLKVTAISLDPAAALVVIQDVSEEVLTQKIRREFVSHASHELKSPVASLQVLAEAVQEAVEASDHETAQRFSEKVLNELARMSKLVNDLLDLSRLEDPASLPEDPCDLAVVTRKEISLLEEVAHAQDLRFVPQIRPEVWIKGDAQQLGLLVRNLVDNAIQYTPSGGTVTVDLLTVGEVATLRVADNGAGIPLESQSRIFERFYRVDRARSRDRGGTGLGLAIVKHVVELHGGTIDLHSELGAGSTFTVTFPLLTDGSRGQKAAQKESA